jgi:hypothetical protein
LPIITSGEVSAKAVLLEPVLLVEQEYETNNKILIKKKRE